jgi:flavin reductase (DIM6/NTAB) family NADH-FMN oxidoreductase RutF
LHSRLPHSQPPLYSLSFTGREPNDTLKNILATKELCISLTSDWIIEAANFTSVNTPSHISEWELSGLTPVAGEAVRPPYVAESPYSVECRLHSHQDIYSKVTPEVRTCTLVIVEVVRFHIWEDALGPDLATADPKLLRPVFRAGGIIYGSCWDAFELPRPDAFRNIRKDDAVEKIVQDGLAAKDEASSS